MISWLKVLLGGKTRLKVVTWVQGLERCVPVLGPSLLALFPRCHGLGSFGLSCPALKPASPPISVDRGYFVLVTEKLINTLIIAAFDLLNFTFQLEMQVSVCLCVAAWEAELATSYSCPCTTSGCHLCSPRSSTTYSSHKTSRKIM